MTLADVVLLATPFGPCECAKDHPLWQDLLQVLSVLGVIGFIVLLGLAVARALGQARRRQDS